MAEETQNDAGSDSLTNAPKVHTLTDEQMRSLINQKINLGIKKGKEEALANLGQTQEQSFNSQGSGSYRQPSQPVDEQRIVQGVLQALGEVGAQREREEEEKRAADLRQAEESQKKQIEAEGQYYLHLLKDRADKDEEFKKLVDPRDPGGFGQKVSVFHMVRSLPKDQRAQAVFELAKDPELVKELESLQRVQFDSYDQRARQDAQTLIERKIQSRLVKNQKPSKENAPLENIQQGMPASEYKEPETGMDWFNHFKAMANRKG